MSATTDQGAWKRVKSGWDRRVFVASGLAVFAFVLLCLVYWHSIARPFEPLPGIGGIPWLDRLLRPKSSLPLAEYRFKAGVFFARDVWICAMLLLAGVALIHRRRTVRLLHDFVTAVDHPVNLAVFRIMVFWLIHRSINTTRLVWFTTLPEAIRDTTGLEWVLGVVPIDPTWANAMCGIALGASLLGMLGLFTRPAAWVTLFSILYLYTLDQMFGKANHERTHLVWFAALLAVSPCADVLSFDSLVGAWRRARAGETAPPAPSRAYGLPLRAAFLLFGIIYFFPGFWKLWEGGVDWVASDHLKYMMYSKWYEKQGWLPWFRIDQYPLLSKLSAASAIAFEVGFMGLILFPRLRLVAAAGGLMFHTMTNAFMRISFYRLQLCYVVFVNWEGVLRRLGTWLFPKAGYLLFDGSCPMCRRTVASLRVFDVLGRVDYVSATDDEALEARGLNGLSREALIRDMHFISGGSEWAGFEAYRALAWRIPLFWPVVPLLYVPPIPATAQRIYRKVADGRVRCEASCSITQARNPRSGRAPLRRFALVPTAVVAVILIAGNVHAGAKRIPLQWPFACFPAFSKIVGPEKRSMRLSVVGTDGAVTPMTESAVVERFGSARFYMMIRKSIKNKRQRVNRKRLVGILKLWSDIDPDLRAAMKNAQAIRFEQVTVNVVPERAHENPVRAEFLYELKLVDGRLPATGKPAIGGGTLQGDDTDEDSDDAAGGATDG